MKKNMLSIFFVLCMVLALTSYSAFAEEAVQPEDVPKVEEISAETEPETTEDEPTESGTLDLLDTGISNADENTSEVQLYAEKVSWPVEGGNIYFDPSSRTITSCDRSVTRADIPAQINGVQVISIGYMSFWICNELTSVTIPSGVTSIEGLAFSGCSGLTNITIPSSVTSIGSHAFSDCSGLTSITIPGGVTSIGDSAFWGCSGLTSIAIPSGVTSIGESAFWGCSGLTSVTIPGGVTSIENETFYGCSGLTSITIPSGVTSIGESAFYGCSGLTSITIPSGVTSIRERVFQNCSGLTSINIPDRVTSIEDYAFCGCSGLTSITIPGGVTSIGKQAFGNCSGLTRVTMPVMLSSGREFTAFEGCTAVSYVKLTGVGEIGTYGSKPWGSNTTTIDIEEGVTSIGQNAFYGCSGLANITVPSSVTSIGNMAFQNCSGLTSITIPSSVTSIGQRAFQNCSGLTSIIIPSSVTSIEYGVFFGCSGLTSVSIPISVTSIGGSAFEGCSRLSNVTIPDNVTSIGKRAFGDCSGLTGVTMPVTLSSGGESTAFEGCTAVSYVKLTGIGEIGTYSSGSKPWGSNTTTIDIEAGVTGIGERAFWGCSGLTSITIPDGVTCIEAYAFLDCSGLTSVTIPGSTTSIGECAFKGCSRLTSVTIPATTKIEYFAFEGCTTVSYVKFTGVGEIGGYSSGSKPWGSNTNTIDIEEGVTSIGDSAFEGCSGLTSITIPSSVTSIGHNAFSGCSGLTSVTIPGSVTSIGGGAFSGCSGLTSITIPGSVTSIGSSAFSGCSGLTSITIPNSVTSIGSSAFSGCSGLTSITIPNSVTSIGEETFSDCSGLTSITILGGVTSIGTYAFSSCSRLTSVTIPAATEIAYGAFRDCTAVSYVKLIGVGEMGTYSSKPWGSNTTTIDIAEGITSIGDSAFSGCSGLTSITIPSSVTSIGGYAFDACKALTDVYYGGTKAQWNAITFGPFNTSLTVTIHYNRIIPDFQPDFPQGNEITFRCSASKIVPGEQFRMIGIVPNSRGYTTEDFTMTCSDTSLVRFVSSRAQASIDGDGTYVEIIAESVSSGTAKVTLSASDGRSASCELTIGSGMSQSEFDLQIYRADKLLDTSIPSGASMRSVFAKTTPCGIAVPALQQNGWFQSGQVTWALLCNTFDALDDPTNIPEFALERKNIYSAVLLDILETSTEYGLVDEVDGIISDAKSYVSTIKRILEVDHNIDVTTSTAFKSMSAKDQETVQRLAKEYFSKKGDFAAISAIDGFFSKAGNVLDIADTIETYFEKCATAVAIYKMGDDLKTVVRTMAGQCSLMTDPDLWFALQDCITIINCSVDELQLKLYNNAWSTVGIEVGKRLVSSLWKEVKLACNAGFPVLDVLLAGYKTGKFVSNTLFKTDSTIEQYYTIVATMDIEALVEKTYSALEEKYRAERSSASAGAYLAAVDLMFSGRDQDCINMYQFVDILDDAPANQIGALFDQTGSDQRQNMKKSIDSIQRSYASTHRNVSTSWIYYLEEDYPNSGLFEQYEREFDTTLQKLINKKYVAACPIDVYVYDANNSLVAYVIDNKPYCSGNIGIIVDGETKELYFYDDADYRIEYVGYDSGDMDVTITEYDENAAAQRDVYFYDVPLAVGASYNTPVTAKKLDEESYSLASADSNIAPELDTHQTGSARCHVDIISGSLIVGREFLFETDAHPDERIDIYAYVPEGYQFAGWTSSAATDIFADTTSLATTIRVPQEDVTITAQVVPIKEIKVLNWNPETNEVQLLDRAGLLTEDTKVFAASFNTDGKMVNTTIGHLTAQTVVTFPRNFETEQILFFLDENYLPICPKVQLEVAKFSN